VTLFGKILVMLNLALSLLLCTWALGVYTNRTDWSSKEGPPEKVKGEVFRRQYQAGESWKSVVAAESRWKNGSLVVRRYEYYRPENERWYAAQLKELEDGPNPVKAVVMKAGQIVPDQQQAQAAQDPKMPARPMLEPAKDKNDKPLRSLDVYRKEFLDTQVEVKKAMEKFQELVKEDTNLTTLLGGEKQLRHRQELEDEKQQRVRAEIEDLKPPLINSQVEGELLLKRRTSLEARVRELLALGVTASRDR